MKNVYKTMIETVTKDKYFKLITIESKQWNDLPMLPKRMQIDKS